MISTYIYLNIFNGSGINKFSENFNNHINVTKEYIIIPQFVTASEMLLRISNRVTLDPMW